MKRFQWIAIGAVVVIVAVSSYLTIASRTANIQLVGKDKTVTLNVEIADTPTERAEGLMNRESIPENGGMLFVFDEEQDLRFWMKNTQMPLDIIFFDKTGRFVSTTTMEPCEVSPCKSYRSQSFAKYALETNAGFVEKNGIRVGWQLKYRGIKN